MKVDVYTKGVLTVIAVCLVILTLNQVSVIPTAQAAAGLSPMEQDNQIKPNLDGSINVRIIEIRNNVSVGVNRLPYSSIPVEVKNTVPVLVKNNYISTKPW